MKPIQTSPETISEIERTESTRLTQVIVGGPEEQPPGDEIQILPCPALIDHTNNCIYVEYQLNELEVAALAHGQSLWLTVWGGLPIHRLNVLVE